MSQLSPYHGVCYEDSPKVILARIVGLDDALITQSTLSNLYYRVDSYASQDDAESCTDGTEILDDTALTISAAIYNTAQTGSGWPSELTDGFNFKTTIPAASFPTKGRWYRIELWCDPTSGDDFLGGKWVFECLATARD